MPLPTSQPGDRLPPILRLDQYAFVIAVDLNGQVRFALHENVLPTRALQAVAQIHQYLDQCTQPQPPREQPTPHYDGRKPYPYRDRIDD